MADLRPRVSCSLKKVQPDGNAELRVILICRQSAVSAVSSIAERVLLRPLDVMIDLVELIAASEQRQETDAEHVVIKFIEA